MRTALQPLSVIHPSRRLSKRVAVRVEHAVVPQWHKQVQTESRLLFKRSSSVTIELPRDGREERLERTPLNRIVELFPSPTESPLRKRPVILNAVSQPPIEKVGHRDKTSSPSALPPVRPSSRVPRLSLTPSVTIQHPQLSSSLGMTPTASVQMFSTAEPFPVLTTSPDEPAPLMEESSTPPRLVISSPSGRPTFMQEPSAPDVEQLTFAQEPSPHVHLVPRLQLTRIPPLRIPSEMEGRDVEPRPILRTTTTTSVSLLGEGPGETLREQDSRHRRAIEDLEKRHLYVSNA